jgi:hypothetical protein
MEWTFLTETPVLAAAHFPSNTVLLKSHQEIFIRPEWTPPESHMAEPAPFDRCGSHQWPQWLLWAPVINAFSQRVRWPVLSIFRPPPLIIFSASPLLYSSSVFKSNRFQHFAPAPKVSGAWQGR